MVDYVNYGNNFSMLRSFKNEIPNYFANM